MISMARLEIVTVVVEHIYGESRWGEVLCNTLAFSA
jgi:hypothetical protein